MAKQVINLGASPTGAGGDDRRSAWVKARSNFTELYNWIAGVSQGDDVATALPAALPVAKGGTGGTTPAAARAGLQLGSAAVATIGTGAGQVLTAPALGLGDKSVVGNSSIMGSIDTWSTSFGVITPDTRNGPVAFGTMLNLAFPGAGYLGSQLFMGVSPAGILGFRSGDYSQSAAFNVVYHTGNTTRAADGTLKAI
nr:hypothetical protein [uncultured Pseudomonas sp.]